MIKKIEQYNISVFVYTFDIGNYTPEAFIDAFLGGKDKIYDWHYDILNKELIIISDCKPPIFIELDTNPDAIIWK